jgi:hypothetical protein
VEWLVYLADGTIRSSSDCRWEDVPDGVLVVRVWGSPKGEMVLWGDAYYGRPDTLKMEARVSDEAFAHVLTVAWARSEPPSLHAYPGRWLQ